MGFRPAHSSPNPLSRSALTLRTLNNPRSKTMNMRHTNSVSLLRRFAAGGLLTLAGTVLSLGQAFTTGSDGSYGDLIVTNDTVLSLPADGVFKCNSISVTNGG